MDGVLTGECLGQARLAAAFLASFWILEIQRGVGMGIDNSVGLLTQAQSGCRLLGFGIECVFFLLNISFLVSVISVSGHMSHGVSVFRGRRSVGILGMVEQRTDKGGKY
ncbi:hypothetical protein QBC38DRAFT_248158 [Podospora fimiseda]|uniref:Uncharacterized protein n=1 Tax=Podospora fimiseda TaxID=252190 RepID=A0AAN7BXR2_9PEZI|nr:hypothetical protein QBC38DRAFT_248158 [Podospora fimiseda]